MTRSRPLLAALTAAALLTAGCTSAHDPQPNYSSVSTTPTTSSPTPTTSPSPTGFPSTGPNVNPGEVAPTEPPSVADESTVGALAFAAYYVESLDWAFATENSDFLPLFYAPTCSTCQSRLDYLQGLFSAGKRIEGGRLAIKKQEVVSNDGRRGATVAISTAVSVGAVRVLDSSGATATADPGIGFITLTTWLSRDANGWRIVEERYA